MILEVNLQILILILKTFKHAWDELFAFINNTEPRNSIISNKIFLAKCVKLPNFFIIRCPYSSRVGEPLSLYILKPTKFRHFLKWNVPSYGAHWPKNYCSRSNTFWDISSQSFQNGSGTPCNSPKCKKKSKTTLAIKVGN